MAKKRDDSQKAPGDAVKSYTLVMSVLVVVMAVLYFILERDRKAYAAANVDLERDLTPRNTPIPVGQQPKDFVNLAYQVEQLSRTYSEASGGAGLSKGIPAEMMRLVTTKSGLSQFRGNAQQEEKASTYETIHQKWEFEGMDGRPAEIWRLLTLVYNIESRGPYRVTELHWQVADPNDNPTAPFDKIKRPNIQVSIRGPARKD